MSKIKDVSKKFFLSYRGLPNKKPYLEFVAALLSIPVLLTVIILNLNSLKANKETKTATTTASTAPVQEKIYVTLPNTDTKGISQAPCKANIGPIDIDSPQENETVTDNPVTIGINYKQGSFCSVLWSYRINEGKWSDYDDKSIALYNLPAGDTKFELRVKSMVSNDSQTLTRNFTYNGEHVDSQPTVSSGSAN